MAKAVDCYKYLMFCFNLLLFLGGVTLLAVGIWVVVGAQTFRDVISANPIIFSSAYIIIVVGALLFLVGFLGCCGAIKENIFMLGAFIALLIITFIAEIIGGALAYALYPLAKSVALDSMLLYNYNTKAGTAARAAWDAFQDTFKCCGINDPSDWIARRVDPPPSCVTSVPLQEGCKTAIKTYFWVLCGISLLFLVIEFLVITFSCLLCRNMWNKRAALKTTTIEMTTHTQTKLLRQ